MNTLKKTNHINNRKVIYAGVLTALAVVVTLLTQIPLFASAPYLKFDAGDFIILIGSVFLGPLYGIAMLLVSAFFEAITTSGGLIGYIMHVFASGVFIFVPGLVYKKRHSISALIVALIIGCMAMTLIMIPLNYIFDPMYGIPISAVTAGIGVTIAFNLIKSFINSVLFILLFGFLSKTIKQILKL